MKPQDKKIETPHLKLGKLGEELVAEFLEITQHQILERNWRCGKAEIDIIAKTSEGLLLFIEVKTRSTDYFGPGSASITKRKKKLILDAAVIYCQKYKHLEDIRFDVANVYILINDEVMMEYLPDAFFDEF